MPNRQLFVQGLNGYLYPEQVLFGMKFLTSVKKVYGNQENRVPRDLAGF